MQLPAIAAPGDIGIEHADTSLQKLLLHFGIINRSGDMVDCDSHEVIRRLAADIESSQRNFVK